MRYIAIFPALLAFVSLILAFLCVFAGSKTGYLESYNIISLNTSRIGVDIFDTSNGHHQDSGSGGFFGSIFHDVSHEFHHLSNEAESEIEHAVNDGVSSLASAIGMHDFYSVHVLDFCTGFYNPSGTSHKNVTSCSNTKGFFTFSPSRTFQRELDASATGVTLDDLHWPSAIDEAVDALKLAFNAMFVLYCIGTAATGLSFWGSMAGMFLERRILVLINVFLAQLAFFSLMITSAIVTAAATKATEVVNKYGEEINVNATRGDKLIALSWTTDLLMFLASMIWLGDLCVARRKEKKLRLKELQ